MGLLLIFSSSGGPIQGIGSGTLSVFTLTSGAKIRVKAAASPGLSAFISAAAARALVEGTGSGVLSALGGASVVKVRVKATAGAGLSPFTMSATAEIVSLNITATASVIFSPFVSASEVKALIEGFGTGLLNPFLSTGSLRLRITAEAATTFDAFTLGATLVRARPFPTSRISHAEAIRDTAASRSRGSSSSPARASTEAEAVRTTYAPQREAA